MWLVPSDPRKWLRTQVRARGVPNVRAGVPWVVALASLAAWPMGWLLHLCLYRGEWWVRVVESRVGWYTAGRVRYDRLHRSRREADAAAWFLSDRIAACPPAT